MLEYRDSRMPRQTPVVDRITADCSGGCELADCTLKPHRATGTNWRLSRQIAETVGLYIIDIEEQSLAISEASDRGRHIPRFAISEEESELPATTDSNGSRLFGFSLSSHEAEKRYGVMTHTQKPENVSDVNIGSCCQNKKRKSSQEDAKEQREKAEKRHSDKRELASSVKQNYHCGDSGLTAENMAEESCRTTSSLEDGCTLTLDSAATAAESVSKGSVTLDKQQSGNIGFSFPLHRNTDRLNQQRDSCTSALNFEERLVDYHSPTVATQYSDRRLKRTTSQIEFHDDALACPYASRSVVHFPEKERQVEEEDENWLQLGLGSTFPESARKRDTPYRLKGSEQAQQEDLATLQLLPHRSESEAATNCEFPMSTRGGESASSRSEDEQGRLMRFMVPPAVENHTAELRARYMSEQSAFMESSRRVQEPVQDLPSHGAVVYNSILPGRETHAHNQHSISFPLFIESQYCLPARSTEALYHADPRTFEDEATLKGTGISTSKLSEYPYFPRSLSHDVGFNQVFSEDRSQQIAGGQSPMLSVIAGNGNRESKWHHPADSNTLVPWPVQSSTRVMTSAAESPHCVMEPGLSAHQSRLPMQGGQNISDDWQGIVKRFGSNLHVGNSNIDVTLFGSAKSRGGHLPVQNMIATQQAIDRFESGRSYNWENRSFTSYVPSWNSSVWTNTLVRPNRPEIAGGLVLSMGSPEQTTAAAEWPRCEARTSFLCVNQQQGFNRNLASFVQQSEAFSLSERMRLTKLSRGQQGIWFTLQARENQNGEQELPQIPKNYLRIKDGKMPISVIKKYVVLKLGLSSESEVEIACRGQIVMPSLSLQHVRDTIWLTNDLQRLGSMSFRCSNISSSSKERIMILTYQRHL